MFDVVKGRQINIYYLYKYKSTSAIKMQYFSHLFRHAIWVIAKMISSSLSSFHPQCFCLDWRRVLTIRILGDPLFTRPLAAGLSSHLFTRVSFCSSFLLKVWCSRKCWVSSPPAQRAVPKPTPHSSPAPPRSTSGPIPQAHSSRYIRHLLSLTYPQSCFYLINWFILLCDHNSPNHIFCCASSSLSAFCFVLFT